MTAYDVLLTADHTNQTVIPSSDLQQMPNVGGSDAYPQRSVACASTGKMPEVANKMISQTSGTTLSVPTEQPKRHTHTQLTALTRLAVSTTDQLSAVADWPTQLLHREGSPCKLYRLPNKCAA